MAKHTPGPWHRNIKPASRYPVIFYGRNKHVVTAVPARDIPDEEAEANHNLLVAAPAMLAALEYIMACADRDDFSDLQPVRDALASATREI